MASLKNAFFLLCLMISPAMAQARTLPVTIEIEVDGSFRVDGELVPDQAALQRRVDEFGSRTPAPDVTVKNKSPVNYQATVAVLKMLGAAHIAPLGLVTQRLVR